MKIKNIGILTSPTGKAGAIPVRNIVNVLGSISNELFLISGGEAYCSLENHNEVNAVEIVHKTSKLLLIRIINYILMQFRMSINILQFNKNVDVWVYLFGETLILPIILSKLLNKKILLLCAGSTTKSCIYLKDPLSNIVMHLEENCYRQSDLIILYSPALVNEFKLQKYSNKIRFARHHYINLNLFKIIRSYKKRSNLIGYIGRLSDEKGVLNFIESIDKIILSNDTNFMIIGDGPLQNEVKNYISNNLHKDRIKMIGWISHEDLPNCLNDMKLIVLPSYTEGLPNIMLESMACGTPVLATPVGAIPDFLTDCRNGFLLEDNSSECIATNVIRALEHPDLEGIALRARALVEREFTFERTVEQWKKVMEVVADEGL